MLIKTCVCGNSEFDLFEIHGIPTNKCRVCGVIHQYSELTPAELKSFYLKGYQERRIDSGHTYAKDLGTASHRWKKYSPYIEQGAMLLDVGHANGAFVDCMVHQGLDAYGIDLVPHAGDSFFTGDYKDSLFDFQVDVITMHDVLEHFINPLVYLQKAYRGLKSNGGLIIDFPNFWADEGVKHWKLTEHLWFFTVDQLEKLLDHCGFQLNYVDYPIPGKMVLYTTARDTFYSNHTCAPPVIVPPPSKLFMHHPSDQILICTAGVPGSGKSVIIDHMFGSHNFIIPDSDIDLENGLTQIDAKHQAAFTRDLALSNRRGVIMPGAGVDILHFRALTEAAKSLGYKTLLLEIETSVETSWERNKLRQRVVPKSEIWKYHHRLQKSEMDRRQLFDQVISINNEVDFGPESIQELKQMGAMIVVGEI